MATIALGTALWHAGKAAFNGQVDRAIPRIVDTVVKRLFSGRGMSARGQRILIAFRDSMIKYGRQSLANARGNFRQWLLAPDNREDTAEFLNEEGIEMVDMGSYEALDGMDMAEAAAAASGASGSSLGALFALLEEAIPPLAVAGGIVAAGEKRKSQGVIKGAESALADDIDSFLHPFRHPGHTIANMFDPLHIFHGSHPDEPDPKKPKPTPHADSSGDFSGLVSTFYNPVTGRIIGYKGIPRKKRKFSTLQRYSPFWKEQMRLTQTSVLAGPS